MLKLTKCPTCGSRKIRRVTRDWTGVYRGQAYTVRDVERDECPDCGEEVFDGETVERIQAHRPVVPNALETAARKG
jgi:YgiT-type zinc finger domain-containing protein